MFLHDLSFAAPELLSLASTNALSVRIPAELGRVEESYAGPSNSKTLYLIQDAHVNESAQRHIASILANILTQDQARYVFLEAGTGDDSLSSLRGTAPVDVRRRVADQYLKKGYLQGPDYLDLTTDLPVRLWGVEDKTLYEEALSSYRGTLIRQERALSVMARIERTLRDIKALVSRPTLRNLDDSRADYLSGRMPLTDYFNTLLREARGNGVPLNSKAIDALDELIAMEKRIDFQEATRQETEVLKNLPASETILSASPLKYETSEKEKVLWAFIEEKIQGQTRYQALADYIAYRHRAGSLGHGSLIEDLNTLEERLFDALATSEQERTLRRQTLVLESMRRMLELKAASSDAALVQQADVTQIMGWLNARLMESGTLVEDSLFVEEDLDTCLDNAKRFYALTGERDEHFIRKILQKMDEEGQARAVFVAGGFHAENLKRLLREKGVSFVSVLPQVTSETNLKKYQTLLLGDLPGTIHRSSADRSNTLPAAELFVRENGSRIAVKTILSRAFREAAALTKGTQIRREPLGLDRKEDHPVGTLTFRYFSELTAQERRVSSIQRLLAWWKDEAWGDYVRNGNWDRERVDALVAFSGNQAVGMAAFFLFRNRTQLPYELAKDTATDLGIYVLEGGRGIGTYLRDVLFERLGLRGFVYFITSRPDDDPSALGFAENLARQPYTTTVRDQGAIVKQFVSLEQVKPRAGSRLTARFIVHDAFGPGEVLEYLRPVGIDPLKGNESRWKVRARFENGSVREVYLDNLRPLWTGQRMALVIGVSQSTMDRAVLRGDAVPVKILKRKTRTVHLFDPQQEEYLRRTLNPNLSPDFISGLELANRIKVSQSTISKAVKEQRLTPDRYLVRGRRTYYFFHVSRIPALQERFNPDRPQHFLNQRQWAEIFGLKQPRVSDDLKRGKVRADLVLPRGLQKRYLFDPEKASQPAKDGEKSAFGDEGKEVGSRLAEDGTTHYDKYMKMGDLPSGAEFSESALSLLDSIEDLQTMIGRWKQDRQFLETDVDDAMLAWESLNVQWLKSFDDHFGQLEPSVAEFLAWRMSEVVDDAGLFFASKTTDIVKRARIFNIRRMVWSLVGRLNYLQDSEQGGHDYEFMAWTRTQVLNIPVIESHPMTRDLIKEIRERLERLGPMWFALDYVPRGGALNRGMEHGDEWTVGDHTLFAMALLPYLAEKQGGFHEGDVMAMIERVALHDATEIVTLDITPEDGHRWANKKEVEEEGRILLLEILKHYKDEMQPWAIGRWKEKIDKYEKQDDKNSLFVKQMEKTASLVELLVYAERFPQLEVNFIEPVPTEKFHQWVDYRQKLTYTSLIDFYDHLDRIRWTRFQSALGPAADAKVLELQAQAESALRVAHLPADPIRGRESLIRVLFKAGWYVAFAKELSSLKGVKSTSEVKARIQKMWVDVLTREVYLHARLVALYRQKNEPQKAHDHRQQAALRVRVLGSPEGLMKAYERIAGEPLLSTASGSRITRETEIMRERLTGPLTFIGLTSALAVHSGSLSEWKGYLSTLLSETDRALQILDGQKLPVISERLTPTLEALRSSLRSMDQEGDGPSEDDKLVLAVQAKALIQGYFELRDRLESTPEQGARLSRLIDDLIRIASDDELSKAQRRERIRSGLPETAKDLNAIALALYERATQLPSNAEMKAIKRVAEVVDDAFFGSGARFTSAPAAVVGVEIVGGIKTDVSVKFSNLRATGSGWFPSHLLENIRDLVLNRLPDETRARLAKGRILLEGPGPTADEVYLLLKLFPEMESLSVVDAHYGNLQSIKSLLDADPQVPHEKIKLYHADLGETPFGPGTFDMVYANAVYDTTLPSGFADAIDREDAEKMVGWVREMKRVMSPKAIFISMNADAAFFDNRGFTRLVGHEKTPYLAYMKDDSAQGARVAAGDVPSADLEGVLMSLKSPVHSVVRTSLRTWESRTAERYELRSKDASYEVEIVRAVPEGDIMHIAVTSYTEPEGIPGFGIAEMNDQNKQDIEELVGLLDKVGSIDAEMERFKYMALAQDIYSRRGLSIDGLRQTAGDLMARYEGYGESNAAGLYRMTPDRTVQGIHSIYEWRKMILAKEVTIPLIVAELTLGKENEWNRRFAELASGLSWGPRGEVDATVAAERVKRFVTDLNAQGFFEKAQAPEIWRKVVSDPRLELVLPFEPKTWETANKVPSRLTRDDFELAQPSGGRLTQDSMEPTKSLDTFDVLSTLERVMGIPRHWDYDGYPDVPQRGESKLRTHLAGAGGHRYEYHLFDDADGPYSETQPRLSFLIDFGSFKPHMIMTTLHPIPQGHYLRQVLPDIVPMAQKAADELNIPFVDQINPDLSEKDRVLRLAETLNAAMAEVMNEAAPRIDVSDWMTIEINDPPRQIRWLSLKTEADFSKAAMSFVSRFAHGASTAQKRQVLKLWRDKLMDSKVIRLETSSGARLSLEQEFAKFGIKIVDGRPNFDDVPKGKDAPDWVMDKRRDEIIKKPIHTELDTMPRVRLLDELKPEDFPKIGNGNHDTRLVIVQDSDDKTYPAFAKKIGGRGDTRSMRELIASQLHGYLGISPLFNGVLQSDEKDVHQIWYVTQLVIGEEIYAISEDKVDQISSFLMEMGLPPLTDDYMRTRDGHIVAIDMEKAFLAGTMTSMADRFINTWNDDLANGSTGARLVEVPSENGEYTIKAQYNGVFRFRNRSFHLPRSYAYATLTVRLLESEPNGDFEVIFRNRRVGLYRKETEKFTEVEKDRLVSEVGVFSYTQAGYKRSSFYLGMGEAFSLRIVLRPLGGEDWSEGFMVFNPQGNWLATYDAVEDTFTRADGQVLGPVGQNTKIETRKHNYPRGTSLLEDEQAGARLAEGARSIGMTLEQYLLAAVQAFPDIVRKRLPLKLNGRFYIFQFKPNGKRLIATAEGMKPFALDPKNRPQPPATKKDPLATQDLVILRRSVVEKVNKELDGANISTDGPVIEFIDLDLLPKREFSVYLDALMMDIKKFKASKAGRNVYFIATGENQDLQRALAHPDGGLFLRSIPAELEHAKQVHLVASNKSQNKAFINLPTSPLTEGEVPVFFALLRLAAASGRIDLSKIPQGYINAFATLAGVTLDTQVLHDVLSGLIEDLETLEKYALKPLAKVSIQQAVQYFRLMKKMLEQSA